MSKQNIAPAQPKISSIVQEASERQRSASDPLASAWVGASAGSGKTKVLTDRILRLLLPREDGRPGTRPEKILALTFTKAGANEMSIRISKRLSEWAVMSDGELIADMDEKLLGRHPTAKEIESARKLFARVIDAPGGLKIMTIHSFCQSILGRFPIEAGLPPNFKALEEGESKELLTKARKKILVSMGRNIGSPLHGSLTNISKSLNEDDFIAVLGTLVAERKQMEEILRRHFGIDGLYTAICKSFGIKAGQTFEEMNAEFCTAINFDEAGLRYACAHMAAGKTTDQEKANQIQDFLDAPSRIAVLEKYISVFLTGGGTARAKMATKGIADKEPRVLDVLLKEQSRILSYEETRKAITCGNLTRDLFRIGEAVIEEYQRMKERRGVLDFDDMILRTLALLSKENINDWIMFKLDSGLDHVLVDEAQDTNPEQWDIIRLLCSEFFTGLGASDETRTLFVVGDDKQSIFSFQRAAPEKFWAMHEYFEKKIAEAGQKLRKVDIVTSFRSVDTILRVVDGVFEDSNIAGALTRREYLPHIAKREGQAGIAELWPLFETRGETGNQTDDEEQLAFDGWFMPDRIVDSQSSAAQIAAKIGDTIKNWLDTGEKLESYDRPIQPGDIMILLRSRTLFVGQLVRALKRRNIAVSGVDRMILGDQLVVQDLCAAAAFALLPDDDLTLATLLKSPLIGMQEDALQKFALGRSKTLWESINKNGDRRIITWLESLVARAGVDHPYEFFSRLVQEPCPANEYNGMQAIRVRLGEDALDPLDEFLNTTLSYESTHGAGLQSFLKWQEDNKNQIKREMDEGAGSVRIMTVHGAKGLQAPIVFLPDTVRTASGRKGERIFWPQKTGLDVPFFNPSKTEAPEQVRSAKAAMDRKEEDEYYRLLYVAMTRAEERLYIGGFLGKKPPSEESKTAYWYNDIRTAFEKRLDGVERIASGIQDEEGEDIPILRLTSARTQDADNAHKNKISQHTASDIPLPDWVTQAMPQEPVPPRPLAPSKPSTPDIQAVSPLSAQDDYRFRRGNATHRLLQTLPDLPQTQWKSATEKFLGRTSLNLPQDLQKEIAQETLALLNNPVFKGIFGPGSMAEVPVTGMLDAHTLISGQIDRLLIRDTEILIVDYKTNRPPPDNVKDVPEIYIRQMKAYAATLKNIYPDRKIRCALLWTHGAQWMDILI